jgi:probable F420-dependent oxidoreductase
MSMAEPVPVALKLNVYGLPAKTPFDDFLALAEEAEALGFDGLYLPDHLFLPDGQMAGFSVDIDEGRPFFPDPWSIMPALASRTSKVRIGPQVTPLMRMDPRQLARAGAAIDWISGGRFVLQVGTGWNKEEYRAFGLAYDDPIEARHRRLSEGVRLIRGLWSSPTPVTFRGEFFTLEEAPLWPKPLMQPSPPIWIGGNGRGIRQIVAEVGDGWVPSAPHGQGMNPDVYSRGILEVRALADAAGRSGEDILAGGMFFVVIGETSQEAIEIAGGLLGRDIWRDLSVSQLADQGIAFIGAPEQVLEGMLRFVDAGVQYFTVAFMPISGRVPTLRQMRLFKMVLDALADR